MKFIPPTPTWRRALSVFALVALVGALAVWAGSPYMSFSNSTNAEERVAPPTAPELLRQIARELAPTAAASRELLLGQRDPRKGSCVPDVRTINASGVPMVYVDPKGGPGSALAYLPLGHNGGSLRAEYHWMQSALRGWLQDLGQRNAKALSGAVELCDDARSLATALAACKTWPAGLDPVAVADSDHWLGACLQKLQDAVAARDLPACRRWADELASAAFALADLHRWVDFIARNGQDWLDFQVRCEDLFGWTDDVRHAYNLPFVAMEFLDRLPGATLITPTLDNLREVERQAERLFQVLPGFLQAAQSPTPPAGAVPMPPDLRETFTFIRSRLSPRDQDTWDRAAASPFHRSYLANTLYRASKAQVVPELALALRRLGRELGRPATVEELMSVAFYRGGEVCGGLVWADRFDLRLMEGNGRTDCDNEQALLGAHGLTNRFLGGWQNYTGGVWTLQQALDQGRFDCVRGTDMIGSLYRNAGHAGYRLVRLMWGLAGHSVSGCETTEAGRPAVRLVDSLVKPGENERWPSAYFRGHDWPQGYPGPRGPLYAAELYVRGLDNYLFSEGYVIRGPHAGTLVRAAIPYDPDYPKPVVEKAYAGPYPAMPEVPPDSTARGDTRHVGSTAN